mmetsp:Transcript_30485/g.69336  ORF Transcript_30485/g.69336 Transcript_30485/m.69336 type:complete len:146 (+) Transcript_30485:458-895(+)
MASFGTPLPLMSGSMTHLASGSLSLKATIAVSMHFLLGAVMMVCAWYLLPALRRERAVVGLLGLCVHHHVDDLLSLLGLPAAEGHARGQAEDLLEGDALAPVGRPPADADGARLVQETGHHGERTEDAGGGHGGRASDVRSVLVR